MLIVFENHREREDEIENVVYSETRQVAVSRRLHRLASQHDDADDVADAAERHYGRHDQLECYRLYNVEHQQTSGQLGRVAVRLIVAVIDSEVIQTPVVEGCAVVVF